MFESISDRYLYMDIYIYIDLTIYIIKYICLHIIILLHIHIYNRNSYFGVTLETFDCLVVIVVS